MSNTNATMTGALSAANRPATGIAASGRSAPITMRSGCRKSRTAEPSRRNSGLATTFTPCRPVSATNWAMVSPVPRGTVLLVTMTAVGHMGRSAGLMTTPPERARRHEREAAR